MQHAASLLSVGFFYLFGNSRPDSQAVCALSSAGCSPTDSSQQRGLACCWLQSAVAGLTGGVISGSVPKAAELARPLTSSQLCAVSREQHSCCLSTSPGSPGKNIFFFFSFFFCQEENILKSSTSFAITREVASWGVLTRGRQCRCCGGFASCDKEQTEVQRGGFSFSCGSSYKQV